MHHVKDEEKEDDKEEENDDDDDDDDYEVKEDIAFITKTIPKLSKKKNKGIENSQTLRRMDIRKNLARKHLDANATR
jgi:hypothetical protein